MMNDDGDDLVAMNVGKWTENEPTNLGANGHINSPPRGGRWNNNWLENRANGPFCEGFLGTDGMDGF